VVLLSATILSFVIPLLSIPIWNATANDNSIPFIQKLQIIDWAFTPDKTTNFQHSFFNINWLMTILGIIYSFGLIYRFWKLCSGIITVVKLIRNHDVIDENGIRTVYLKSGPSFFTFLNYIFINTNKLNISDDEFSQVIEHEKTHIVQRHTIDNFLMEIAILICWFNPVLRIMKKELNNVHEFYADAKASALKGNTENYSRLLLKIASNKESGLLTHQFSMNTTKKRIIMLNKFNHSKRFVLRYILIAPCLILLSTAFSFVKKSPVVPEITVTQITSPVIGTISWERNTRYTDDYLTEYLGLKTGDQFNEEAINKGLSYRLDGSDLGSLFMDQGYLYFTLEMKKDYTGNRVDLTIEIYEGEISVFDKVYVKGNDKVSTEKILKMIDIREGELFSRSKLVSSLNKIIQSGFFDSENTVPNLIPHPNEGTVDIEFKVVEL
jgi:hypothetical protein